MKRFVYLLFLAISFLVVGCDIDTPKQGVEKIIAVEPHHATRIIIVYKDKNGSYYSKSIHQSGTFTDGNTVINPHDYLSLHGGKKVYGPLPGCEKEYQNYRHRN